MKKSLLKSIILALIIIIFNSFSVLAMDNAKIMRAVTNDNYVKVYVKGIEGDVNDIFYQIGARVCDNVNTYKISDDEHPISTLIMIDNSLSVSQLNREKANQVITDLIASRIDGETFRLATFSDKISYLSDYSNDYSVLKKILDEVEYKDQETYLTDVLYDVISEFNADSVDEYRRIIIISDGVDNKSIGITNDELYSLLNNSYYPIYSLGSKNKSNNEELENMFALSRATNAEYYLLDDVEDTTNVTDNLNADHDMVVFKASLDSITKDGSRQNTKLSFTSSKKCELHFDIQLPFEESSQITDTQEETTVQASIPAENTETSNTGENTIPIKHFQFLWILGLIIPIVAIVVIVIIIAIVLKKKKKEKSMHNQELDNSFLSLEQNDEGKTEMISRNNENDEGKTEMLFTQQNNFPKSFTVQLRDSQNPYRILQCELRDTITIGRKQENSICIDFDKSVSSKHCEIAFKSNQFKIYDLNSANGTIVNGKKIYYDAVIKTGDILKIGRTEFTIEIK